MDRFIPAARSAMTWDGSGEPPGWRPDSGCCPGRRWPGCCRPTSRSPRRPRKWSAAARPGFGAAAARGALVRTRRQLVRPAGAAARAGRDRAARRARRRHPRVAGRRQVDGLAAARLMRSCAVTIRPAGNGLPWRTRRYRGIYPGALSRSSPSEMLPRERAGRVPAGPSEANVSEPRDALGGPTRAGTAEGRISGGCRPRRGAWRSAGAATGGPVRRTARILRQPGSRPYPGLAEGTDTIPQIKHVVVLMMENHSNHNHLGMLPPGGRGRVHARARRQAHGHEPLRQRGNPARVPHADDLPAQRRTQPDLDRQSHPARPRQARRFRQVRQRPGVHGVLGTGGPAVLLLIGLGVPDRLTWYFCSVLWPDLPQPPVPDGGHVARDDQRRRAGSLPVPGERDDLRPAAQRRGDLE